ncbi:MAG: DUF1573 domain-containing protein [Bacteroidota bacterium]
MKKPLILFLVVLSFGVFAQEAEEQPLSGPKIFFAEKSYNFGEIVQGDRVSYTFEFENTGNEPLILSDVKTTCGCTAPEWPREPIVPGTKAELKVVFNSTGKLNMQNKVITVMSNAVNNPARVKIVGNVVSKDSQQ